MKAGNVDPKSSAGTRSVPIATVLRDQLIEHKLRSSRSEGLVFGRTSEVPFGGTCVRKRATKAWLQRRKARARDLAEKAGYDFDELAETEREKFLERAGFEPITLHQCRHTFASLMIGAGVNAKALSSYMGHSSNTFTLDRYGHLMPGNEDEAAKLLDDYLERANTKARLAQIS